ncbi:type II secretion system protein F [Arthrobacter sp. MYb229]|uniref:type II secretion system F family protein n=1 Tax=unclassified Arthrobacter TaxID=235627 RepID=UPI000CFA8EA4|nr:MULTISPECIES: type II secretion system F family protein [unclassified Arthrobacter]PQZ99976.1 type II secretion system protein F [Arthrobacter sp. MYb229]PRB48348.1 type II secretion system protein F [Arthrobacter sp. MYb216]
MNSLIPWAVLCGFGFGLGLWMIIVNLPAWRPMSFAERVAPHIRVGMRTSRMLEDSWRAESRSPAVVQFAAPLLNQIKRLASLHSPGTETVRKRLRAAGLKASVVDYRSQEIICALFGLLAGSALMALLALSRPINFAFALIVALGCGMLGFMARGWWLNEQIQRRARKVLTQFPTVAEVLALTVGAGESTTGAIERISRICHGVIGDEFTETLNEIHAGNSMIQAMQNMSDRIQVGAMTRFVDAIVVATERGTPLAQVLRDQAQDVRDASKRELMEVAGKREISMLIPIVFGVLPLTIVFAVFPGLALLEMSY